MRRGFQFLIRASSFLTKEIYEILRQPRLIFSLIIGPFLILLLFGVGYRNQARALRALFVVPADNPQLRQQVEQFATSMGPQLLYAGVTDSLDNAKDKLRRAAVDVVVVAPPDAYDTILDNKQAVFTLYHNEIDPYQANYVQVFGQIYVDEVNRRVLREITEQQQADASSVKQDLAFAHENTAALRIALEQGDAAATQERAQNLDRNLSALELGLGLSSQLLGGVRRVAGPGASEDDAAGLLGDARARTNALGNGSASGSDAEEHVAQIEDDLQRLETKVDQFERVDPAVLVSPFRSEVQSVASVQLQPSGFYAPAAIILLLQHFAITFAGLSLVRERRIGTIELFRVAPLSAFEVLLGKYTSFIMFTAVLSGLLGALMVFGIQVPMLGSWLEFVAASLVLIFTALGLGFVISLVAETTSQAVQYAMLVLLASVFFGGFFLSLDILWAPVRIVSWLLPATYGVQLMQNVMFRGTLGEPGLLANLAGMGLTLALASWLLLRRLMAHE